MLQEFSEAGALTSPTYLSTAFQSTTPQPQGCAPIVSVYQSGLGLRHSDRTQERNTEKNEFVERAGCQAIVTVLYMTSHEYEDTRTDYDL